MIIRTKFLILIVPFISLLLGNSDAQADNKFSGYIKNYTSVQDSIDNDLFRLDSLYSNQLSGRFMLEHLSDRWAFQVHYESGMSLSSNDLALSQLNVDANEEINQYRLSDLRSTIGPDEGKHIINQNLDRFNVQWQLSSGDLTIGRQAITLGSARIINPTDIFLPFDVQTLNTEYRRGIDAIRFQKPLGQLSEFDIGFVLGEDGTSSSSAIFAQLQTHIKGSDVQFTAIRFSEQNLLGLGIQSSVKGFGYWFEAAHVNISSRNTESVLEDKNYYRISTGLDYGLTRNIFALLEYHYNGAGTGNTSEYTQSRNLVAYRLGGVFLLGRHYLIPTLSWQVSPLLSLSAQAISNLDDRSNFINLSADYSLTDNLFLATNLYLFTGAQPSVENGQVDLKSEYGPIPNRWTINLRYYF